MAKTTSSKLLYWISGPRLPLLNLVAALITCAVIMARRDWVFNPPALVRLLDIIARVSVVFFLLSFVARPLNEVFHSKPTRWLQKNRRYFGLAFAAWFLQHLWLLPLAQVKFNVFGRFWMTGKFAFPAITILLSVLMVVTSINRAQRSMPGWKALHWIGMQALWTWFLVIYLKFVSLRPDPYVFLYVGLFISAQALRMGLFARKLIKKERPARVSTPDVALGKQQQSA
ncbi:MAG: hypothetical protein H0T42_22185 [Deltaproteobacteria bacterium]|nr:hypothetical protein [Deltaproteobacteria bacterium]